MSQPSRVSSAAVSRTAAYSQWLGSRRADPKMVARYRSRLVGRSRVRLFTVSHSPRIDRVRISSAPFSSERGTSVSPGVEVLLLIRSLLSFYFDLSARRWPTRCWRIVLGGGYGDLFVGSRRRGTR